MIEPNVILVVDDNPIFRNTLAEWLHGLGHQVLIAGTGEAAFIALRDWPRRVGWLYSRANLPGLIDGWILADEYHDSFPRRAAVLSSYEARTSAQGHIVLPQPTPSIVLDTLRQVIEPSRESESAECLCPFAHHAAA